MKLAFAISPSITFTEKYPDAKAAIEPTAILNQSIEPSAPDFATSITVRSREPSITGMLIKNENVATCLPLEHDTVPPKIDDPER